MPLLYLFAFISGLVTILAPCIWPILPIILATSATGGHRKPLGITLGVIISFGILTLALSYIVRIIPLDANALRLFAAVIIGLLGLTLIIPKLSQILEGAVSRLSGKIQVGNKTDASGNPIISTGFWPGFVIGLALGVVWAPCAGPILATIAALAATQKVSFDVILTTVSYVIGIGIPLFIFATLGRKLFTKSRKLNKYTGIIQRIFGIIMILTALLIVTNYDKVIEANLLNAFPAFGSGLNAFESNPLVSKQLDSLKGGKSVSLSDTTNGLFNINTPAPNFIGITHWLNTPDGKPLTIADLKGKVVLVDFWTYTCINCIRTLPYVTSWYDKYNNPSLCSGTLRSSKKNSLPSDLNDKCFVVVGVHTPEFEFEKNTQNVENAIKQYKINYPVGQDNNYDTWNTYSNQYWPAEYLIDAKGNIRRTHFGEGEYDQMEEAIQALLKENLPAGKQEEIAKMPLDTLKDQTPAHNISPETYLGSARMQYLYPNGGTTNGTQTFTLIPTIPVNTFSYGGEWTISDEDAVSGKKAVILYNFEANKAFIILRPSSQVSSGQAPSSNGKATVKVLLDGKPITPAVAGADVKDGIVTVDSDRLYNVVDLHGKGGSHLLRLEFQTPGTQAFTFTFG